ncbi:MAG TPA: hypothetical protein VF736_21285 [Pyrinomonadaceae bacterium]|jgi:FtsP/CotA-like multicopper oxidase with cupredoxin domain
MRRLLLFAAAACLAASAAAAPPAGATPPAAAAQCRGTDRAVPKRVRFARGRTTAVVKDTVRLCTSHEYRLRARAGQTMTVHLATGSKTSFTLYTPAGDTPDGADGSKDWSGELPESGEYTITIGTDATAAYTLEVTIR